MSLFYAIVPLLIDAAIKGSLLLIAALIAARCMRRAAAASRHLLFAGCFAGLLLLPLCSFLLPGLYLLPQWASSRWNLPAPTPVQYVPPPSISPATIETASPALYPLPDVPLAYDPPHMHDVPKNIAHSDLPPPISDDSSAVPPVFDARKIVFVLYLSGTLFFLTPLALAALALHRLRRASSCVPSELQHFFAHLSTTHGPARAIRLLQSRSATLMPMTWGLFRPTIVLPHDASRWPAERLRCVLLHELAHIRRRDCLTLLVTRIACALYWFHPLVWIALFELRAAAELACDDLVLAAGTKSSTYAEQLLSLAAGSPAPLSRLHAIAAIAMARPTGIHQRVRAILDPQRNRGHIARRSTLMFLIAGAAFTLTLSLLRAEAPSANAASATYQHKALNQRGPEPSTPGNPGWYPMSANGTWTVGDAATQPVASRSATVSEPLLDFFPNAQAYLREIDGSVAVTFPHNLDPQRYLFGAIAEDLAGKTHGNAGNSTTFSAPSSHTLLRMEDGTRTLQQTTLTFHDLPLAQVKSIRLLLLRPATQPLPTLHILLDPAVVQTAEKPPSADPTAILITDNAIHFGDMAITATAGYETTIMNGKITAVIARGATVTGPAGTLLWADKLELKLASAVSAPATAPATRAATNAVGATSTIPGHAVLSDKPETAVAGATLFSSPITAFVVGPQTTDAQGNFTFSHPSREVTLMAISPDRKYAGLVIVKPTDTAITLPLAPAASATGRALNADGTPFAKQPITVGIHVVLSSRTTSSGQKIDNVIILPFAQITTNADASFTVEGFIPGQTYQLSPGTNPGPEALATITPKDASPLALGDVTTHSAFVPSPGVGPPRTRPARGTPATAPAAVRSAPGPNDLAGRILDYQGNPVAKATVIAAADGEELVFFDNKLDSNYSRALRLQTTTDDQGFFLFSAPAKQNYRFAISTPALHAWLVPAAALGKENLVRLPQPASLTVRYDIPGGPDVATFQLHMNSWENPAWKDKINTGLTLSVPNGKEITFHNLAPVRYDIQRRKTAGNHSVPLDWIHVLDMHAGQTLSADFVRNSGQQLRGRILGLGQFALEGAHLYITELLEQPPPPGGNPPRQFDILFTGPDGKFQSERMPPGKYQLLAFASLPNPLLGSDGAGGPSFSQSMAIAIPEIGDLPPIEFTLISNDDGDLTRALIYQIDRMIANLDAPDESTRAIARQVLLGAGNKALPALHEAAEGPTPSAAAQKLLAEIAQFPTTAPVPR